MKVAHRNIPGQALTGRVGTVNYECGEDITRKERGQILSRVPDDKDDVAAYDAELAEVELDNVDEDVEIDVEDDDDDSDDTDED